MPRPLTPEPAPAGDDRERGGAVAGPGASPRPRPGWNPVLLSAAVVAPLFLLRLGAAPLFDVDEGAFSEATRELLASGDWLSTTLNGTPRFDKPILVYWLQALSVRLLGVHEAAFRLPSALCAWAWCIAVAHFARPRLGGRIAALAGIVAGTSVGVLAIGRASTADALLNLLLALSLLDAWRHLESGRAAPLRRMYAWIGLGLLAKGPIALIVPVAVTLTWCGSRGEWRRWARAAFDLPGWAILLAVAGPWYAYALLHHGMAFVDGFLIRHNVARYTSVLESHRGSLGYYVLMLPVMLLPWSALLPTVLRRARATWADPLGRFLLIWAAFVVAFFSFSGTKLPHYVLYGSTPVFILIAAAAEHAGRAVRALTYGAIALVLAVAGSVAWVAPRVAPLVQEKLYRWLLAGAGALPATSVQLGAAVALVAWAIALVATRRFEARAAAGAVAAAAALVVTAVPWVAGALQGPVKRAALLARADGSPAVQWDLHVPSFSVYREQITPRRPPRPGELAIIRLDRTPADERFTVVYEERGYALVRMKAQP